MSSNPDKSLELNTLIEALNKVEKRKGFASAKRITSLMEFIGGFEKWSQLNEDCRLHIAQFLDYKSRCQLEICSKQDQVTVKNTPIHVNKMKIFDNEKYPLMANNPFDNVQVQAQFGKSTKKYSLVFSKDGEDTKRQWLKCVPGKRPEYSTFVIKSSNYYQEAVKFAEGLMKKGNFELDRIHVNMSKYPCDISLIKPMPFCKDALIVVNSLAQLDWWLSKLPENMYCLDLSSTGKYPIKFVVPFESLDVPQVRTVHSFSITGKIRCTDQQFLNLTNKSMYFFDIGISDEAINNFIKKWINGKRSERFEQAHLGSMDGRELGVILNGIKVTYWDDNFREEAGLFCWEFRQFSMGGDTYEIASLVDPFESLTMNIVAGKFNIYHTGKRVTRNGKDSKGYFVPRGYW